MNSPTPASLMEEAEKAINATSIVIDELVSADGLLIKGTIPKVSVVCDFNALRDSFASALHSIQAQTIREMVERVKKSGCAAPCKHKECENIVASGYQQALEALRSYAKDKGIEIE